MRLPWPKLNGVAKRAIRLLHGHPEAVGIRQHEVVEPVAVQVSRHVDAGKAAALGGLHVGREGHEGVLAGLSGVDDGKPAAPVEHEVVAAGQLQDIHECHPALAHGLGHDAPVAVFELENPHADATAHALQHGDFRALGANERTGHDGLVPRGAGVDLVVLEGAGRLPFCDGGYAAKCCQ